MSGRDERQADAEIMAQRCDGFQAHVASALNCPSSFCSSRSAPTRRITAASFGKMPTTSLRQLLVADEGERGAGAPAWLRGCHGRRV